MRSETREMFGGTCVLAGDAILARAIAKKKLASGSRKRAPRRRRSAT